MLYNPFAAKRQWAVLFPPGLSPHDHCPLGQLSGICVMNFLFYANHAIVVLVQ
jgi:hypothetical protein